MGFCTRPGVTINLVRFPVSAPSFFLYYSSINKNSCRENHKTKYNDEYREYSLSHFFYVTTFAVDEYFVIFLTNISLRS